MLEDLLEESNLEKIKFKLEANTYVMSCHLTRDDLYSDMRNDISLLVDELCKCYSEIADKEEIIKRIGTVKAIFKKEDYCPSCDSQQDYLCNPYYIHICTVCKEQYYKKDLIRR